METSISKKQIALIMAAITSYIEDQSAQIISLNEQKKSGRWVSASRESFMLKRVMMQMRASGRA